MGLGGGRAWTPGYKGRVSGVRNREEIIGVCFLGPLRSPSNPSLLRRLCKTLCNEMSHNMVLSTIKEAYILSSTHSSIHFFGNLV